MSSFNARTSRLPSVANAVLSLFNASDFVKENKDKYPFFYSEEGSIFHDNLLLVKLVIRSNENVQIACIEKRVTNHCIGTLRIATKESEASGVTEVTMRHDEYLTNQYGILVKALNESLIASAERMIRLYEQTAKTII